MQNICIAFTVELPVSSGQDGPRGHAAMGGVLPMHRYSLPLFSFPVCSFALFVQLLLFLVFCLSLSHSLSLSSLLFCILLYFFL